MDTEGGGTTVSYLCLPIVLSSHTKSVSVMLDWFYGFLREALTSCKYP